MLFRLQRFSNSQYASAIGHYLIIYSPSSGESSSQPVEMFGRVGTRELANEATSMSLIVVISDCSPPDTLEE
jgi:hypothetical protein